MTADENIEETIKEWCGDHRLAERIAGDLGAQIISGMLEQFSELPSSEHLAWKFGTSRRTVSRAKQLLARENLAGRAGNGYFVRHKAEES